MDTLSELLQGFLIGVVLALAAGALMIYLHRVNAPPPGDPPPPDPPARDRPKERRR